jgi:hypothetical protein
VLVNPYAQPLPLHGGSRMLQLTLGVVGFRLADPAAPNRLWTVQALYAPIPGRRLGGLRAKLTDQSGFVTFCNQRDFEVLLGVAEPGSWCPWAEQNYVEPGDQEWYGLCADSDDLVDDLYERELAMRIPEQNWMLPPAAEIVRLVHTDAGCDFQDLLILVRDYDPDTGYGPDVRIETIEGRWSRSERVRARRTR